MRRIVALLVVAGAAWAKPATVHVDAVVKSAWLIAEVEILAVEKGDFMGNPRRGGVRVRVTTDPDRIYRGAGQCGRTLDLRPLALGPARCTRDLASRIGRAPVLLVVDAQRAVAITGARFEGGYAIRSYCDHNACLLRCDDAGLARAHEGRKAAVLLSAGLRGRFGGERSRFWALAAPVLLDLPGPLADGELERLLRDLTGDIHERSQQAYRRLYECGAYYLAELRRARERAEDPDSRRRLDELLKRLAVGATATAAAARLPIARRRTALRLALPSLETREREAARKILGG